MMKKSYPVQVVAPEARASTAPKGPKATKKGEKDVKIKFIIGLALLNL